MQNVAVATAASSATHNRTRDFFLGLFGLLSTEELVLIHVSLNDSSIQPLTAQLYRSAWPTSLWQCTQESISPFGSSGSIWCTMSAWHARQAPWVTRLFRGLIRMGS